MISSAPATCHENAVNAFDYLCPVQRHRETVRREPDRWLPWNCTIATAEVTAMAEASSRRPVTRAGRKLTFKWARTAASTIAAAERANGPIGPARTTYWRRPVHFRTGGSVFEG